jgi:hypothetical protein
MVSAAAARVVSAPPCRPVLALPSVLEAEALLGMLPTSAELPMPAAPAPSVASAAAATLASRKADPGVGGRLARLPGTAAMAASSLQPTPPPPAGQSEGHSPAPCPWQVAPLLCLGALGVLVPEAPSTVELVPSVATHGATVPATDGGCSGH